MKLVETDQLAKDCAEYIASSIMGMNSRDAIVIGLPGGRTIAAALSALQEELSQTPEVLRAKLHFFLLDERLVALDDEQSNFHLLNEKFFRPMEEKGLLRGSQVHPFVFSAGNEKEAAANYTEKLNALGGRFSIAVLGVGEDGHIASLFPHHTLLNATEKEFLLVADSPKPPSARVTASPSLIANADSAILLFSGEAKAAALKNYRSPEVGIEDCPAKIADAVGTGIALTDIRTS